MVEMELEYYRGADVLIDNIPLSDIPVHDPEPIYDIDDFRSECLSNGVVSCGWGTLHARLIDHSVSAFWWLLTESERRSIATMAIKNTLFYAIYFKGTGKADCAGAEEFEDMRAGDKTCGNNAVIRYLKFAHTIPENLSSCYWKKLVDSNENCFVSDETYNLPCHIVSCAQPAPGYGHYLAAIQVAEETHSLDNWIIFQYSDCDIYPGHWQLPHNTHIKMGKPTKFQDCGGVRYSDTIAEFDI